MHADLAPDRHAEFDLHRCLVAGRHFVPQQNPDVVPESSHVDQLARRFHLRGASPPRLSAVVSSDGGIDDLGTRPNRRGTSYNFALRND
jgi:hypothetical protein